MPANNGCNPPCSHEELWKDPSKWGNKIPNLDASVALGGMDLKNLQPTADLGASAYRNTSKDVAEKLSKGLLLKMEWVTGRPIDDAHAAASALRLFQCSQAYINALNDIPNNGPQPVKQARGNDGAGDDSGLLVPETLPADVSAMDILKAGLVADWYAASEEPAFNPTTEGQ